MIKQILFKFLGVILFLFIPYIAFAQAFTVDKIRVKGNQRIETSTIKAYLDVEEGKVVTDQDIDDGLKALFSTGLFADVFIKQESNDLVVEVIENPIIHHVEFEGNSVLRMKSFYLKFVCDQGLPIQNQNCKLM